LQNVPRDEDKLRELLKLKEKENERATQKIQRPISQSEFSVVVLIEEKEEWKPFRNALYKLEKKQFDEMWDIPRLYVSACSNSCQLVPLHPIIMSILFHHYKELKECSLKLNN
jgi:hypothetical protein